MNISEMRRKKKKVEKKRKPKRKKWENGKKKRITQALMNRCEKRNKRRKGKRTDKALHTTNRIGKETEVLLKESRERKSETKTHEKMHEMNMRKITIKLGVTK